MSGEEASHPMDQKDPKAVLVPLKVATAENTKEFGRFVTNFEEEKLWMESWPQTGWRLIQEGSGVGKLTQTNKTDYKWVDDEWTDVTLNHVMGFSPKGGSTGDRKYVYTWEANYHPNSGQVFYPATRGGYVLVLAHPNEDVKPEEFVAFYFDGSHGFQVKTAVWHTALFSQEDEATLLSKYPEIHPILFFDSYKEFGTYLKVPLIVENN